MIESRFRPFLAIGLVVAASVSTVAAAGATTRVTVPAATPIAFHLLAPVNTQDNHVGDVVPIETVGDTIVDGWVAVPDGSKGSCAISKAEQSGGHGHPGSIELTCSYVISADHGRIKLSDEAIEQQGEKKKGIATVAGVLTYGLASNAVHGNEATINTTRTMTAHTADQVHVLATVQKGSDSGGYDK